MAKKVTKGKGAVPAKKKAAGKKIRKTIKPSEKADIKKKSSINTAKTAAKTTKPAAKKGKPQKTKKSSKAVKTKKVAAKTIKKTEKKIPVKTKGKKVLPEVAKKRGKEITAKKPGKQKQRERENQIEKRKEKKTGSIKAEKPKVLVPRKKEKKAPEQAKKVIKKTREKPKKVVLKKEKPEESPVKKVREKEIKKKVVEKTKKVVIRKEEKALPEKVAKIVKPKKKAGGRVKTEIQAEEEPKKVREIKREEGTGRGQAKKAAGREVRKAEAGKAAREAKEFTSGVATEVSVPAGKGEKTPELPLFPAQTDTHPPAPLIGLPAEYGENEIAIIIVEPRKIFLFWEVRESTLRIFHGDLHIRVYDVTDDDFRNIGEKFCLDLSVGERIGSLYLDVLPAREYVADIGILYEDIFITIARSNKVTTPRGAALDEGLLPAGLLDGGQRIGY